MFESTFNHVRDRRWSSLSSPENGVGTALSSQESTAWDEVTGIRHGQPVVHSPGVRVHAQSGVAVVHVPVGPSRVAARIQALALHPESHRAGAALLALAVRTTLPLLAVPPLAVPSLAVHALPSDEVYAFASQAIHLDVVHFVSEEPLQSVGSPAASNSVELIRHAVSHPNAGFISAEWWGAGFMV